MTRGYVGWPMPTGRSPLSSDSLIWCSLESGQSWAESNGMLHGPCRQQSQWAPYRPHHLIRCAEYNKGSALPPPSTEHTFTAKHTSVTVNMGLVQLLGNFLFQMSRDCSMQPMMQLGSEGHCQGWEMGVGGGSSETHFRQWPQISVFVYITSYFSPLVAYVPF